MSNTKDNIVEKVNVANETRYLMSVSESLNSIMILSKDAELMADIKRTLSAVIDSLNAKNNTIVDIAKFVEKSKENTTATVSE